MPILDYNSRLKFVKDKGLCGDKEYLCGATSLRSKLRKLCSLLQRSKYTVVFTGAGISTSCGIADFRGPNGVWTKELKNIPMEDSSPAVFNLARPSVAHYALVALLSRGLIHHVISQNVDGLHLRSGMVPRDLTELHGNIFMEVCTSCQKEYFRSYDVGGMGLKLTGNRCIGGDDVLLFETGLKPQPTTPGEAVVDNTNYSSTIKDGLTIRFSERRKRKLERKIDRSGCGGFLRDNAVDWDTPLPEEKFQKAQEEIQKADLVITLGTSLRIRPAGSMPEEILKKNKKRKKLKATGKVSRKKEDTSEGGVDSLLGPEEEEEKEDDEDRQQQYEGEEVAHLVVVNLQKTHVDERASLVVHARCDDVMKGLCDMLGIEIADTSDPVESSTSSASSSSAGNIALPSSPSSSSSASIH